MDIISNQTNESPNLQTWWLNEFSFEEREYICNKYKPMGGCLLSPKAIEISGAELLNLLIGLRTWFRSLADSVISEKILVLANSMISNSPVLDVHFLLHSWIEHCYKKRNIDVNYYELAKTYCKKQIEISPRVKEAFLKDNWDALPRDKGFEQLAIILEKEKKYDEALHLCNKAMTEGWGMTDWQKRIDNLNKKFLAK